MKDKNLPNNYNSFSLEELINEANIMIEQLENKKDLEKSIENYQKLLKLNLLIEKEFRKNFKNISEKTKEKINKIILKKNEKNK